MESRGIAFRMDDVGSASKRYEVYGRTRMPVANWSIPFPGNFLFFKYMPPFKKWGIYPELKVSEWEKILQFCVKQSLKLTVGITAGWVEWDSTVVPFPQKYPKQAKMLAEAHRAGIIEIANHGYTHCVLDRRRFRPRFFSGNRESHREFWDFVPLEVQEEHITKSQYILESMLGQPVVTFIPPGNIFSEQTLRIAKNHGLRYLSCHYREPQEKIPHLIAIPQDRVLAFHDKDIVNHGLPWLENVFRSNGHSPSMFVRDIGMQMETQRKG